MKHLTFADKNLLIDDALADALMDYVDVLLEHGTGDTVDFHALGSDGDEVTASIVMSAGMPLMTESSRNALPEPDNAEAVAYIEERMALLRPATRTEAAADEAPGENVEDWLSEQY